MKKIFISYLLLIIIVFSSCEKSPVNSARQFLLDNVKNPTCSQTGGEWTIIALAKSGGVPDEYKKIYLDNLGKHLEKNGGILHETKSTEYSRVIMALFLLGENPEDFKGYNLLLPLSDFDFTIKQGINGAVFCLLSLDSKNAEFAIIDDSSKQNSRERLVDYILSCQNDDGGFSLMGNVSDPDVTALAISALCPYSDNSSVKTALEKAALLLKNMQDEDGFYISFGERSSESISSAIVAFSRLKDVETAEQLLDRLLKFKNKQGYSHIQGQKASVFSTEQALLALAEFK